MTELHNPKKATHRYLSSSDSPVCWKNVSDDVKKLLYGRKATNDEAESALGSATHEIQKAGRIDIPNAAAVSDVRRNRIFQRSASDKERDGMFHCFEDVLQECIMRVGMKDAPNTRVTNNEQLEEQLKVKQKKMELAKEKNMESATESYIDALYYIAMYGSDKCARDVKTVEEILKRLPSDAQRYVFLKENITIYVKGFGWDEYKHAWSKNGRKYTVKELAAHLKFIIKDVKTKRLEIPKEPKVEIPQRVSTAILGTMNNATKSLDEKYFDNEDKFKADCVKLRSEREARGEGSIYAEMQPFVRPTLPELVGKRIDFYEALDIPDTTEKSGYRRECYWHQGEVLSVVHSRQPKVNVLWDKIDLLPGYDDGQVKGECKLLPSLYNKQKEGAWRMDIDIEVGDEDESNSNDEDESESEDESEEESESESEMSIDSDDNSN